MSIHSDLQFCFTIYCSVKWHFTWLSIQAYLIYLLCFKESEYKKPKKEKKKKKPPKPVALPPCFVCKRKGKVIICDNKVCNKAYHAKCLKEDERPNGTNFIRSSFHDNITDDNCFRYQISLSLAQLQHLLQKNDTMLCGVYQFLLPISFRKQYQIRCIRICLCRSRSCKYNHLR